MKDTILSLTKALIRIPSTGEDIQHSVEILELVKQQLPKYPFTAFASNNIPSLLFSNKTKDRKKFKIILNAHLDVVPGSKEQFMPTEKNGKLYGRGTFDTKAAAAVMILLFNELGNKLSYPLGLQLPTDEERDGRFGTGYQVNQGIKADFAICAESNSNFQVTNQSKGRYIIKIGTNGFAAHSAYAWKGENALLKMHEILAPVLKAYPYPKEETHESTVNLTKIESHNDAINRIPDKCTAYLDIRYTHQDTGFIVDKIRSLLPKNIDFETIPLHSAHTVTPNNPYIAKLRHLVKNVRGEDLPLRFAHATSDATFLKQAIEFGPVGANAHADDEWVDIQSLVDYYTILKQFLLDLET